MDDIFFSKHSDTQDLPPLNTQPEAPRNAKKRRRKRSVFTKVIISALIISLLLTLTSSIYIYSLMQKTDYNETGHENNVYLDSNDLMQDENVINILFIGVDARVPDENSRSDSMILFSIDKNNKKIKLTSFMRDTWVTMPKKKNEAKLNAACNTSAGAQYVIDTIEYNFNIKIDSYFLVDFDAFMTIIDRLGGINVEITENEAKNLRDEFFLKTQSGDNVHLDGNEALWYCRIRYLDSDFMRTFRQRKVITSIIVKAKSTNYFNLIDILKDILPVVETDINPFELTKLAIGAAFLYIHYDIEQTRVPADGTWKDATKSGQSVLIADLGKNQKYLDEFLYTLDSKKETTTS